MLRCKDPSKKLSERTRDILVRIEKEKLVVDKEIYNSIYCSDGIMPRIYGLPKICKPKHLLRIIVSSIDSTLHAFASLHKILYNNIPKIFS